MKYLIYLVLILNLGQSVLAHDTKTLRFIYKHELPIEKSEVGPLKVSFTMKESFTKEEVVLSTLKDGKFNRAFVISSKGNFLSPVDLRFENGFWRADLELGSPDIYWLWFEGNFLKLSEDFMASIRIKIGAKTNYSDIPSEILKSEVDGYQATFEKNKMRISISRSGKKLNVFDPLWGGHLQVVLANALGSKIEHAELDLVKDSSEIQVTIPHGLKGETAYRLWIYDPSLPKNVFHFRWIPEAKN